MAEQTDDDDRRARILDGAFEKFSAFGVARTSMADIAEAAGMSRPAVYQHFANKDEIYGAVLGRILEAAADRAIAELAADAEPAERLDGFLQRWFGDLAELMSRTAHGDDIIAAKAGHAKPIADGVSTRVRRAVTAHLAAIGADRALVDVVLLAPIGFKYDSPTVAVLRRRLTTLARTVSGHTVPGTV